MTDIVKNTCKIGQGSSCCRYLVVGADGFECAKHTRLKQLLDLRAKFGTIHAVSDNCEGYNQKESITILNGKKDVEQSRTNRQTRS